ncbi:MAG: hypothetical protein R3B09_28475 [Nannocystaceae bacterium]
MQRNEHPVLDASVALEVEVVDVAGAPVEPVDVVPAPVSPTVVELIPSVPLPSPVVEPALSTAMDPADRHPPTSAANTPAAAAGRADDPTARSLLALLSLRSRHMIDRFS